MDAVLDTSSLGRVLRTVGAQCAASGPPETCLDQHFCSSSLQLMVDSDGALIAEWADTCGEDLVRVLVSHWEGNGWLRSIAQARTLPRQASRCLLQLGFTDAMDKLVLRIAHRTRSKIVVSDDSDFWQPGNKRSKGDPQAPVASACLQHLGVTILLLGMLMEALAA